MKSDQAKVIKFYRENVNRIRWPSHKAFAEGMLEMINSTTPLWKAIGLSYLPAARTIRDMLIGQPSFFKEGSCKTLTRIHIAKGNLDIPGEVPAVLELLKKEEK